MATGLESINISRHDISLLTIAAALIAGLMVGTLSSVGLSHSLLVFSVPAVCSLGYAVFYRPPTKSEG